MEKVDIQNRLNAVSYPQNYYYDIETLEPMGLLKDRLDAFAEGAPEIFQQCDSFLDIGCSIGYFLFYHSVRSAHIVGIEPNHEAVILCMQIKSWRKAQNVKIIDCSFNQYGANGNRYDLIFIGNSFHYLYKDEGWAVLDKLHKISSGTIVMEFPMEGKHIVDIGGWKEDDRTKDFTEIRFKEEVEKRGFSIVRIAPSGTIGERKIVVLKK